MTNNIPSDGTNPGPARPRHHLRLAAIGAMAVVALLGGGITAVAYAAAPTGSTSTVAAPTGSPAAPTSGSSAPGAGTRPARPTAKPHLDGTVTSVSGNTVLMKDRDGFTRTVLVSSKTTYADGLTAVPPVGTEIHAVGTVDSNGTSLDATSIGKRPTPPAGGPGSGPGRGRHGDRDGFGGPPPAGGPNADGAGKGNGTSAPPTVPSTSAAPTTS